MTLFQQFNKEINSSTTQVNKSVSSPIQNLSLKVKNKGNFYSIVSLTSTKNVKSYISVSFSLSNYSSYKIIDFLIVNLPNENQVYATHKRILKITDKFILTDVLFIPSFYDNIISISKLVSNNNYKLVFYSKSYVIQDIKTNEKIGIVKAKDDLYTLNECFGQTY